MSPSRDRMVKIGFAAVAVAIGAYIYFGLQRDQVSLPEEWRSDLDPAMAEAKEQKRPVILLIDAPTGSQAVRQMANITLSRKHNRQALKEGRYIAVTVPWTDRIAEQFNVQSTQLPTTILLDPNGQELRRRVGFIGEVPFRKQFLVLEGEDGEGDGEEDEG